MMNACSQCIHIKNTLLVLLAQFPSAYEPCNLVHLFHCFNNIISPRYPNYVHSSLLHAATSRCSSPTYNISFSVIFFDFKNLFIILSLPNKFLEQYTSCIFSISFFCKTPEYALLSSMI